MDHLAFSTTCAPAYRLYTAKYFHQLCESFGFGRPKVRSKLATWEQTFRKVVKHFMVCKVPECVCTGVPREQSSPHSIAIGILADGAEPDKCLPLRTKQELSPGEK